VKDVEKNMMVHMVLVAFVVGRVQTPEGTPKKQRIKYEPVLIVGKTPTQKSF